MSSQFWQTRSTSSSDTERLGRSLGKLLKGGEVIVLRSDLGGGKTTLVRGLAQGAGSRTRVTSPTFTLSRVYRAKNFEIHHFDFYRLSDPGIMADQLAESINDKQVVVVEWADIVSNVMPKERITIELKAVKDNDDERDITISYTDKTIDLIKKLEIDWSETRP